MSKQTDAAVMMDLVGRLRNLHSYEEANAVLERVAGQLLSDARSDERYADLQGIGKSAAESIAEMVAALECDYDRLEELRDERKTLVDAVAEAKDVDGPTEGALEVIDKATSELSEWEDEHAEELAELTSAAGECESRDDALRIIREDPLSVQVRCSEWFELGAEKPEPDEFEILLGTGGPATRIIGELQDGEPSGARVQAQNWGTPWTDYLGGTLSEETLLTYCRCFYLGEG